MRRPIPPEGMFYKRIPGKDEGLCAVCRFHHYIVVQRLNGLYAIHTRVAKVEEVTYCLHVWRTRPEAPSCLDCFEPTGRLLSPKISDHELMDCLRRI